MNCHYGDILSRIPEPPDWWDELAVPRWGAFSPDNLAETYAVECALVLVVCQSCGREFRVAVSSTPEERAANCMTVRGQIETNQVDYGDPPNVDCCPSGPSTMTRALRVLEYWALGQSGWRRDASLAWSE